MISRHLHAASRCDLVLRITLKSVHFLKHRTEQYVRITAALVAVRVLALRKFHFRRVKALFLLVGNARGLCATALRVFPVQSTPEVYGRCAHLWLRSSHGLGYKFALSVSNRD
jgi:hypothetical protein